MGLFDIFKRNKDNNSKENKDNIDLHNREQNSIITISTNGNNVKLRPVGMTRINTSTGEKNLYLYTLEDSNMGASPFKSIMIELSPQELEECKDDFGYFWRADFRTMLNNKTSGAFYFGGLNKDEDGRYSPTKDFAIAAAVDNINASRGRTQEVQQTPKTTEYQQAVPSNLVPEKFRTITIPNNNSYLTIKPQIDKNNQQKCTVYKDKELNQDIDVPEYYVKWRGQVASMEYKVNAELDIEKLRNDLEYQQFVAEQFLSPERLEQIYTNYHNYAGMVKEDSNTGKLYKDTRNLEQIIVKDNQNVKASQARKYDSWER